MDVGTGSHTLNVRKLATKAMLVKLTSSKPSTSRREEAAEAAIRSQMGDSSLTVSSHIFKDKANPVRLVLNQANLVYSYHVAHTLAWQDRGPRILPVESYERYSSDMRKLVADVEQAVHDLAGVYDGLVAQDMADRQQSGAVTPRDFSADYPSYDEFKAKMKFEFLFTPMPDQAHFLFDISEDDRKALDDTIVQAEENAKRELTDRIKVPLLHLITKLRVRIGDQGAIFRDSAVENIVEQCELAEQLAMGDESLLKLVQEVRVAIRPHAINPEQLRESPIVRQDAAAKLAEVAKRMDFLMGN
jgi:hypothetical protein